MKLTITMFLSIFLLVSMNLMGQSVLWGGPSDTASDFVGTLDQTTGVFTPVWQAFDRMSGLAFDSSGQLWGVHSQDISGGSVSCPGGRCSELIRFSQTGVITSCGLVLIDSTTGERITDISFQPGTDILYGMARTGEVHTIETDCSGGAFITLVGDTGLDRGGMAFRQDGSLFVASVSGELAQIDPTDGSVIGSVVTAAVGLHALAIRPSDDLPFAVEADSSELYTINFATGALTLITDDPGEDLASLAFTPDDAVPPRPPLAIPTLSEWGLILLTSVLVGVGIWSLRFRSGGSLQT